MGICTSTNAADFDAQDGITITDDPAMPFVSFQVELWTAIAKYLRANDVMNLRLASVGIPGAVTLSPRLTSHLILNLDNCPYMDWIWNKSKDQERIIRKWCRREGPTGKVDFPKNITNDELELFISRGFLNETKRASFTRCKKLTSEWFELLKGLGRIEFIEVALPTSITDSELKKTIRYLKVNRLNCIGTSSLTNSGYRALGDLDSTVTELHFLHCKNLKSLAFLGKLSGLQKLNIDGMLNVENTSSLTPIVDDDVLTTIAGIQLRSLVIATRLDVSGIGLVQLSHMRSLEFLALERGAGEAVTDSVLKVLCGLTKLRKLRITDCDQLTDAGLSYLQHLPRITSLELCGSNFTDEGVRQISKVKGLKHLRLIDWEKLTDKGMYYISKMHSLHSLHLRRSRKISDVGVERLLHLKSLRDVHLAECGLLSKGRARLSKNGVRVKVS